MSKDLSHIVIVDLESTCWQGRPPNGQVSDIIEVGVALLNTDTLEVVENEGIIVRPERSTVSGFCTNLTTITQDMVDSQGISLADACKTLEKKYLSKDRLWASYGDYDRRQFDRCCRSQGLRYPFGPTHKNVKNDVAIYLGLNKEVGMPQALEKLSIPLDGTHHRGVDDARNIAKILARLIYQARK